MATETLERSIYVGFDSQKSGLSWQIPVSWQVCDTATTEVNAIKTNF